MDSAKVNVEGLKEILIVCDRDYDFERVDIGNVIVLLIKTEDC